ncbi:hypothetical protein L21SP5_03920 [Salinivirga cyanobacteriivorans]|uniref:Uncharacterized protein n=1 Tax=Salinivirga cyanobacteriivorans TaxID=1307839 RepID=A0A0S2I5F5_9BACT|nr:hypothetical protein [Salinivirga cyanobacteriivorans]ALO17511.1 hypothetical protein L21SP5_03920 [Salinivirga cyanobacteriivorans]
MNFLRQNILSILLLLFLLGHCVNETAAQNNDSLTKLKIERIQQEITILQNRFNRLYNRLDRNTQQLIKRADSSTNLILSETIKVQRNQDSGFEQQALRVTELKNELKNTRAQYRENSLRLYFLLSLAIILLITVFVLLYQIRKKTVEVLAQKSDKLFESQSEIHEKTTELLNLHEEITEAIAAQKKAIKSQKKSTRKATKKALKDVIKKKYRND